MPSKLIIHIGAHKTATTTLQHLLEIGREALLIQKIEYIQEAMQIGKLLANNRYLTRSAVNRITEQLEEIFQESNAETMVISSENFIGNVYFKEAIFSRCRSITSYLKEILKPFDMELSFIFIPRRQDTWLESIYQQWVKWGYTGAFEKFLETQEINSLNWHDKIQYYQKLFPDAEFKLIPFEHIKNTKNHLFEQFFKFIGSDVTITPESLPQKNPGISAQGIEILRRVNHLISWDQRVEFRKYLESNFTKIPGTKHNYLSKNQRYDILKTLEVSNRQLFDNYMPNIPFLYEPEGSTTISKNQNKARNLLLESIGSTLHM